MIDKNKHINYTSEDIQRYLKGEMSVEEMHALEKAALDDPFLADAMEGMDTAIKQHGEFSVAAGLDSLKKHFEQKPDDKPKVVPMKPAAWFKWAAAAVIIIIGGAVAFNNLQNSPKEKDQLAVNESKKPETITPTEETKDSFASSLSNSNADSTIAYKSNLPAAPNLKQRPSRDKTNTAKKTNDVLSGSAAAANRRNEEVVAKEQQQVFSEPKKDSSEETSLKDVAAAGKEIPEVSVKNKAPQKTNNEVGAVRGVIKNEQEKNNGALLNSFRGQVVDQRSIPLSNAIIQLRTNTDKGLLTDNAGHFEIKSNDSIVDVSIASVGYQQQDVRLRNDITMNKVVLKPASNSMDEVVVTGYGNKRANDADSYKKRTVLVQNVEPNGGWMKYQVYLDSNKNKDIIIPDITGEVVVSFQVDRAGILSDFKIEKSLTPQYDQEAIRLIKQGPSWRLLKGRKSRATVIIRF